jgi:hypothetical protein
MATIGTTLLLSFDYSTKEETSEATLGKNE